MHFLVGVSRLQYIYCSNYDVYNFFNDILVFKEPWVGEWNFLYG